MKKQIALLSTILLAGATSFGSIVNASATLSAPATPFDLAFRNNGSTGSWGWYSGDNVSNASVWNWTTPDILAYFNRITNSTYYNYEHTINLGDFDAFLKFDRSNTGWLSTPSGYIPYLASSIGSNSSVGVAPAKVYISLYNKTDRDYTLLLDLSTSSDTTLEILLSYNGNQYYNNGVINMTSSSSFQSYYLPAYSNTIITTQSTSSSRYLDALYLIKGDINPAFQSGYNNGESDTLIGLNGNTIFGVIGLAFGAVANIFNIEVLPNISLGNIFGAIIALAVLFAFLNLLNATPNMSGGKKK